MTFAKYLRGSGYRHVLLLLLKSLKVMSSIATTSICSGGAVWVPRIANRASTVSSSSSRRTFVP